MALSAPNRLATIKGLEHKKHVNLMTAFGHFKQDQILIFQTSG